VTFRAFADNVVIRLEPLAKFSAGGLHLPDSHKPKTTGTREATVMAVGPGHYSRLGALIPVDAAIVAGARVIVDALAGQNYDMDLTVPRHNKPTEWSDDRGEFRIVRADEVLGVVERDSQAAE
jgi:co-chaperonin GroES (HSP10)